MSPPGRPAKRPVLRETGHQALRRRGRGSWTREQAGGGPVGQDADHSVTNGGATQADLTFFAANVQGRVVGELRDAARP